MLVTLAAAWPHSFAKSLFSVRKGSWSALECPPYIFLVGEPDRVFFGSLISGQNIMYDDHLSYMCIAYLLNIINIYLYLHCYCTVYNARLRAPDAKLGKQA
jgi:hypothetical protein